MSLQLSHVFGIQHWYTQFPIEISTPTLVYITRAQNIDTNLGVYSLASKYRHQHWYTQFSIEI